MKIRILGSAAGGGFPQWNCNCRNCAGVRNGTLRAWPRTQSSLAVTAADSDDWVLVNASPDIATQLQANPILQPDRRPRDTALGAIVLTDGQIDHTTGLYMLRESARPWPLWCTDSVHADLTHGNPILNVLAHYCGVERYRIQLHETFVIDAVPSLRWRALPIASKPAPYSPHRETPVPDDNIALFVTHVPSGRTLLYAPGLGTMDDIVWSAIQKADCVLVDGTFWRDDEMIRQGFSRKRARDIGHLPQSGPGGMLEWLARLPSGTRRILIHVNNTNPILDEDSVEYAQVSLQGVEVAFDGMEIDL